MSYKLVHYYDDVLLSRGFIPMDDPNLILPCGQTFKLSKELGEGYYWIYSEKDLFDIKIHNFYFHEDYILECKMPECISISYYQSISGHELSPYRRMNANCIRSYIGGITPYKALIHKKVPIKSIGIEITSVYYKDYLKEKYQSEYINPYTAFSSIEETSNFPEMLLLLNQVADYRGLGLSAKLFYEAKVNEAISLVLERYNKTSKHTKHVRPISDIDKEQIACVTSYIDDHANFNLSLDDLSKIACMGSTKLKQTFKLITGCTITEYIQQKRIEKAEFLLSSTDLTIAQIAQTVGYTNASRFSELFHRNIGILPGEYRKMLH